MAGLTRDEGIFSFILFSGLLLLVLISFKVLAVETMTYFLIGMVLQSVFGRNLKIPIFLGWGGAVVVWGLDHFLMKGAIQVFSYSALVWCTCILGGLWALGDRFSKTTLAQIIAWIGRNSLSILVFHAIFIVSLKPASVWFIKVDSAGWLYSIGSTLFVTALCLLVALISDKIGVSRYLFGTPSFFIPLRQREPQNAPRGRE